MPAQTVIKLRRSTAAQWTSANPVLGAGEPGLETDTNKVKFGDGTTAWDALPYSVTSDIEVAVKNSTAATITKGSVVYINGADGNNPTISLAQANSEMTSSKTLGFVKADIASGATGTVVTEGMLEGLNTDAAPSAGDPIWLSPATAGGVVYGMTSKPVAPNHMVFLGYVVRKQTNNGRIYVKVQNGYELDELHDVSVVSPLGGQVLQYDAPTGLWKNSDVTVAEVTGLQTALDGKSDTGHTHTTTDITDFFIIEPANGETLQYNGTKWVNAPAASGGETISSFLLMGA